MIPASTSDPAWSRALCWLTAFNCAVGTLLGYDLIRASTIDATLFGRVFVHLAMLGQVSVACVIVGGITVAVVRLPFGKVAALVLAPLAYTAIHVFIYLDRIVYSMFRFHINGLAYNVLVTPGGFASMRLSRNDCLLFAAACVTGVVAEAIVLRALLIRSSAPERRRYSPVRTWLVLAAVVLAIGTGERLIYAAADLQGATAITRLARRIPLYQPFTIKRLAARMFGFEPRDEIRVMDRARTTLDYPRSKLEFDRPESLPNILWIVLDSWRFDSFSPEVTPHLWEFAQQSATFRNHLATGNATRFGIFGMFYGLHGSYWHAMLAERRGPVLIERLAELGYRFEIVTPSPLTFPEFRRTVFADVHDVIHDDLPGDSLLDRHERAVAEFEAFLRSEGRQTPFFGFLFFDSTHAPYDFPEHLTPFEPYAREINYAGMGLDALHDRIVNRYRNAVYYLDTLCGRLIDALRDTGKLDDTVVVITGDHAEEFGEHGFWGHNSAFTPEQIHVPLILRIPGRPAAAVTHRTTHHDLAPTFMRMLGVRNPASDYSSGQMLWRTDRHARVVSCGWDECAWIIPEGYLVFGTETHRGWGIDVLDQSYRPHPDADAVLARHASGLVGLTRDLSAFLQD